MRSPLAIALSNPYNLAILALSVAAGLVSAWWLFPIGLVLWGTMVAIIANDPSLRINYNMQSRTATLSPRFQAGFSRVVRSQMRIFNSLLGANQRTRHALEPVQNEVESLVEHVYTVCQQMMAAENYLSVVQGNADYEGQRALLVLSLGGITDPGAKREKEEAIKALDERLQEIKDMAGLLSRAEAQVGSLASAMDGMLAEITGGGFAGRRIGQEQHQVALPGEPGGGFDRHAGLLHLHLHVDQPGLAIPGAHLSATGATGPARDRTGSEG